jgi:hypothetical protein
VLRDFHPYLKDPAVVRRLRDCHRSCKETEKPKNVMLLSPNLEDARRARERDLAVVDFALPDPPRSRLIAARFAELPAATPTAKRSDHGALHRGRAGPHLRRGQNVFAKSLVRTATSTSAPS